MKDDLKDGKVPESGSRNESNQKKYEYYEQKDGKLHEFDIENDLVDKECDKENELENDEKKDELENTKYDQKDGKKKAPKVRKTDPKFRKITKFNNKQHQKKIENYFNKRDTNKKRKRSDEEESIENEDSKKLKAGELYGNGEETEGLNIIMKDQQISGKRDPNPNYDYDPELKLMSELNSMKIKRLENQ